MQLARPVSLAISLSVLACHTLRPVELDELRPGMEVQARISASQAEELAEYLPNETDRLIQGTVLDTAPGQYHIQGNKVCQVCWLNYHGMSKSAFNRYRNLLERGFNLELSAQADEKKKKHGVTWWETHEWMDFAITHYGDELPLARRTVIMPVSSMKELHRMYHLDPAVSIPYKYDWFCKFKRTHYDFVQARKYKPFAQCDYCQACDKHVDFGKVCVCAAGCWSFVVVHVVVHAVSSSTDGPGGATHQYRVVS